jgi:hypothetical protein
VSNEKFLIEDADLTSVKNVCQYIESTHLRNRAVANVMGTVLAAKCFSSYVVDITSGLHNICKVLEDIELSDIYINGNYIDVRLCINENELSVPKSHFDRDILPLAYMFIKINPELTDASVQGFIFPADIKTDIEHDGYYKIDVSDLCSFCELEDKIYTVEDEGISSEAEVEIFDYLDGTLKNVNEFYRGMIKSKEARLKFKDAANAQIIFNFISHAKPNALDIESTEDNLELDLEGSLADNPPVDFDDNTAELLEELDSDLNPIDDLNSNENIIENTEFDETSDVLEEDSIGEYLPDEQSFATIDELVDDSDNALSNDFDKADNSIIDNESVDLIEDYSTVVTPNMEDNIIQNQDNEISQHSESDNNEESMQINDETESDEISENNTVEQIDTLFDKEQQIENVPVTNQKKSSALVPLLAIFVFLIGTAYFGYTKIISNKTANSEPAEIEQIENSEDTKNIADDESVQADAMPVESLETVKDVQKTNEGTAVTIPAVEQNIDASILVSNLSVNWEVPAGYLSNSTAKRYFTKIGKIIQLNLKLELSLLSKPPITNKIAVELEYNPQQHNFGIKNIITSSGEPTVDKLVQQTIQKALDMNLNMNLSSLGNIQGNPVLIIKL